MDPETAHRVAQRLLGLPLPWRRIGGAVDLPEASTTLAGIPLRTPIGLAAGFDKTGRHLDALGKLGFGYVVGGTVTRRPREGNDRPRIVRDVEDRAMVNAMGLPNPGAEAWARTLARTPRTCPRVVSVADEALGDAFETATLVGARADALELNASCPNVSWGRDRDNETHLRELVAGIKERVARPLLVKLPPFDADVEREVVLALARIAVEAGADGLTCGNTRPVDDERLAVGRGGLSGRPLWPRTAASVSEVAEATGTEVHGCGGIFSAEDVRACLDAGARTVQVYTALIYEGPRLPASLARVGVASPPTG
jgi:dihydroorotate dehydrogenase